MSDTGHGIDDATMEHIVEPSLTTKQRRRRHQSWPVDSTRSVETARRHDSVYSEPGHGTIFTYVSLARNADVESYQVGALVASGKGQRILVVDDGRTG